MVRPLLHCGGESVMSGLRGKSCRKLIAHNCQVTQSLAIVGIKVKNNIYPCKYPDTKIMVQLHSFDFTINIWFCDYLTIYLA